LKQKEEPVNAEKKYAAPVTCGVEDKFYYVISKSCILCGNCLPGCPVNAIKKGETQYEIIPSLCIDCGTCSYLCPVGAPQPV